MRGTLWYSHRLARAPIHPLVIFLAVLGGIQTAGPMGIVYGLLLAAMAIESVRIYQSDFADSAAGKSKE